MKMGCPITRGVCRDSSVDTASFRYYSVTAGAVPFHWEVEPGTPKHPDPDDSPILVPLAPPPSWLKLEVEEELERSPDLEKPPGIIKSILPRLKLKKMKSKYSLARLASSPSNSSSSTSTSTCGKSRVSWESSASPSEEGPASATPGGRDVVEKSVEVKGSPTKSSLSCFGVLI